MTKDRKTSIFLYLSERKETVIPPLRKSSYLPWNGLKGDKKSSRRQGKHAIDQVRVENEQSELRVKTNLRREWNLNSQKEPRATCEAFEGTLKDVVKNKGGNIK